METEMTQENLETKEILDIETEEKSPEETSDSTSTIENEKSEEVIDENEEVIIITEEEKEGSTIGAIANALKSDLKAQVEAVLFITDLPQKTGAIAKMLNASYDDVQSSLVQLIQEYEDRNGGLEIGTDDGYIIQVKTQYLNVVTDMMPLELNPGPMRTLSAIALKEPVLQSEIIDMRGSGAYDHINDLVEQDLISKKPQGLSYTLRTTKKFQQYFRLTQEANKIKERLQEDATKRAKEKEKKKEEELELQTSAETEASKDYQTIAQ